MPKKSPAAREQPDKLFAILAEHTEFAELMRIYTRARKPSIMPKLVRLSQGNHGCERCLLITESPKTPGHYRYLIWATMELTGRHGQDSLVEPIRFP